jgi:hypothetical protein
MVVIDLKDLYGETAKLSLLPEYLDRALRFAGEGEEVVLTGAAPVWLYLKVATPYTARPGSCSTALPSPEMW